MSDILNKPLCESSGAGNTGVSDCNLDIKLITGIILANPNKVYTAANRTTLAVFLAKLQADCLVVGDERIYPLFRFSELTDGSEEAKYNTTGYGDEEFASEGAYKWNFKVAKGATCLQANLRQFNDAGWKCFLVDKANTIIGTTNSDGNFVPVTCNFHADKWKAPDGSKSTDYRVRLTLPRPEEINDKGKLAYIACGGDQTNAFDFERDVKGNLDLQLVEVELDFGVATVKVVENCSKTNLYTDYVTELASAAMWTVTNSSGATVVIVTVVADSVNEAFDITFVGTGIHYINLASPTVLAAAGVGGSPENGYEGIELEVTMPVS
jgi:hypothetical protein